MLYVIICEDNLDSLELRRSLRPRHLERIQLLQAEGRLELAGPLPAIDCADPGEAGFTGSLIVAEFGSLEEARAWADADPFLAGGVYRSVTVKPFRKTLPA